MAGDNRVGLRLDPMDVLFFRDGRPFDAASRVTGGLPNPQTLAGALRTALLARNGFDFRRFAREVRQVEIRQALRNAGAPEWVIDARFRGPWLALAREGKPVEPLLPQPAILTRSKNGGWLRSRPLENGELPGWSDPDGLLPLWAKGEPDSKADMRLFTLSAIKEFLDGGDRFADAELFARGDLYDFDDRVGIGVDMETLTSAEGEIYGVRLLSLKGQVREKVEGDPYQGAKLCLYAEVFPPAGAPGSQTWFAKDDALPFGGEGRYVKVGTLPPEESASWPGVDPHRDRAIWMLATPAFLPFSSGRPLPAIGGLRAAASRDGIAVSGWDVARNGPRPTRFAVPAGAVYFVEGRFEPKHQSLCAEQEQDSINEGWGYALQGAWKKES